MQNVDATLAALRNQVEDDDGEWGSVYLDNARHPDQSAAQFRSHLAVLSVRGVYRRVDGYAFGLVRLSDPAA